MNSSVQSVAEIFQPFNFLRGRVSVSHRCRNSFHDSLKQIGSAQHQGNAVGMGTYETMQHFNDLKEHLHTVRRDVEHLVQRTNQVGSDWALQDGDVMTVC